MLYDAIKKLVQYGINTGITPESERILYNESSSGSVPRR